MKFHWFHLMPYPHLPADFRQKYRSVWIEAPSRELYDPILGHYAYNDYLDEMEYAASLGFDGICVNEHHSNAYGTMPSPNLMAASLARRTKDVNLVVMGNSVALYNPVIRVAEEMAMLDVMCGGRLVAGFPVGTPMDTAYAMGQNPATLRDKYREGVELIVRAWKSDKPFAFNGKYTQLRYVNPWPRPLQQPMPPIWVPGSGSVETWRWCIENDFLYAYLSYYGVNAGRAVMDGFWETVDKMGAEMNPYRAGFLQFVAVAKDDAEAEKLYAEAGLYFYRRCLHIYPGFATPPGYISMETIRKGIKSQVASAKTSAVANSELTWKDIVDRGYIVAGSPQTIVDKLNAMADMMNVGHTMVLCHFGNLSKETTLYNTTLFAKEVMPKLRHRFSEWTDRWSPKPMTARAADPAPLAHTA